VNNIEIRTSSIVYNNLYILKVNNLSLLVNGLRAQTSDAVLKLLLDNYPNTFNINQIARKLHYSVGGVFKTLNQLENEGILSVKTLGNAKFYKLNLASEKGRKFCELVLMKERTTILKKHANILENLKNYLDSILIVFVSKGRTKSTLLLVTSDTPRDTRESIKKTIGGKFRFEFSSFHQFKKDLKNKVFLEKFWTRETVVYGESLFFRLLRRNSK